MEIGSLDGQSTLRLEEGNGLAVDCVGKKWWWLVVVIVRLWPSKHMEESKQIQVKTWKKEEEK